MNRCRIISVFLLLCSFSFLYSVRTIFKTQTNPHKRSNETMVYINSSFTRFLQELTVNLKNFSYDQSVNTSGNESSEVKNGYSYESYNFIDIINDSIATNKQTNITETLPNRIEELNGEISEDLQTGSTVNNVSEYNTVVNKGPVKVFNTPFEDQQKHSQINMLLTDQLTENNRLINGTLISNTNLLNMTLEKPKSILLKFEKSNSQLINRDTSKSRLFNLETPESHLINRDIPKSHLINRDTPESHLINRDIPKSHLINRDTPESHLINRDIPKSHLIYRDTPESHLINRDIPKSHLINSNQPKGYLINRDILKSYSNNPDIPKSNPINRDIPNSYSINRDIPESYMLKMTLDEPNTDLSQMPVEIQNKLPHTEPDLKDNANIKMSVDSSSKFQLGLDLNTNKILRRLDSGNASAENYNASVDSNRTRFVPKVNRKIELCEEKLERNTLRKIKVGILIPSCTRNFPNVPLSHLPLINISIPSVYETYEKQFLYRIYIGIDAGDRLENAQDEIKDMFNCAIIVIVQGNNFVKSVNAIAERAYQDGMDYLVRTNDDTKFVSTDWTSLGIAKLREYVPSNIGVVGPTCKEGKTSILTHDMVHRTHLDIFDFYYPPYLQNWWADDWITCVYEPNRSTKIKSWLVKHVITHTRYNVDEGRQKWMKELLQYDKSRLQEHLGISRSCLNEAAEIGGFVQSILFMCCIAYFVF